MQNRNKKRADAVIYSHLSKYYLDLVNTNPMIENDVNDFEINNNE